MLKFFSELFSPLGRLKLPSTTQCRNKTEVWLYILSKIKWLFFVANSNLDKLYFRPDSPAILRSVLKKWLYMPAFLNIFSELIRHFHTYAQCIFSTVLAGHGSYKYHCFRDIKYFFPLQGIFRDMCSAYFSLFCHGRSRP